MALTPLRTYYRGHRLVAMRDEVAGQNRYYHFDYQGTTQCLTDQNGTVTDRFAANAWGVPVKRTGTSINRHWYIGDSGYYRHLKDSQNYVRHRTLMADSARWISGDPITRSPSYLQAYTYAFNSPVSQWDPSGLVPCRAQTCCCCVTSIATGPLRSLSVYDIPAFRAKLTDAQLNLAPALLIHGHEVSLSVQLSYMMRDNVSDAAMLDCKLEWWEWMDGSPTNPPPKNQRKWEQKYGVQDSPVFDLWNKWLAKEDRGCPGKPSPIPLVDKPSVSGYQKFDYSSIAGGWVVSDPQKVDRRLYIYAVIRNDPKCQCASGAGKAIKFAQRLSIRVRHPKAIPGLDNEVGFGAPFPSDVGNPANAV